MSAEQQWELHDKHREMLARLDEYSAMLHNFEATYDASENGTAVGVLPMVYGSLGSLRGAVYAAAHTLNLTMPPRPEPEPTP